MPKVEVKDVIMFLKIFGISSFFLLHELLFVL